MSCESNENSSNSMIIISKVLFMLVSYVSAINEYV